MPDPQVGVTSYRKRITGYKRRRRVTVLCIRPYRVYVASGSVVFEQPRDFLFEPSYLSRRLITQAHVTQLAAL